ncbi:MAG TPA: symmetrical bis(5'-nucleosyl)-tetraphosphatase [Marinagarivorans sp.]
MTDWAIGDIQGCAEPFFRLLERVNFNPNFDVLWVAGDMVNRGPDNLSVLRYIKGLGHHARVVLGNHDLHLLASAERARKPNAKDTFQDVLDASDRDELLLWLRQQPLLQWNEQYLMSHAGVPHIWDTPQAIRLANEVSECLKDDKRYQSFLFEMYGNEPSRWEPALNGNERLRVITNYYTRMRFIDATGTLNLTAKESANNAPAGFSPWYLHPAARSQELLFGHWAALEGSTGCKKIHALDTGCVWGNTLTLMNLASQERISEPA